MLKVIVADDEPIIAQAVAVMLKEIDANLDIAGLCYNGSKAMEMIEALEPDIAILDIRMPGMSGLDILQRISDRHLPTGVIILSAYRDFEYAQEALRFGAEDYLVKPLDIPKLTMAVKRTAKRCFESKELRPTIEQEHYKKLLTDFTFRQQKFMEWGLDEATILSRYRVYFIQFAKNMDDLALKGLVSGLYALSDRSKALRVNNKRLSVTALVGNRSNFAMCIEIGSLVSKLCDSPAYVGFSNSHPIHDFKKACLQADAAVQQSFYEPDIPYFEYDYSMDDDAKLEQLCMIRYLQTENFFEKLQLGLENETQLMIDAAFDKIRKIRPLPKSVFRELQEFLRVLHQNFEEENDLLSPMDELLESCLDGEFLTNQAYIHELVSDFVRRLAQIRLEKSQLDNERIIKRVMAYCEQHYCEDITLDLITDQIHLAKSYFCTMFRKNTGETFWVYLTNLRINRAKELLGHTEIKVNRVAEAVGYRNASHFNRVFSNVIGLTPMEYRRRFASIDNLSNVVGE